MDINFVRVQNRVVRLDAIAYIDFLDSGRSMIFLSGLTPEKQHISVDVEETRRLKTFMEQRVFDLPTDGPSGPMGDRDRPRLDFRERERRFA